MMAYKQARAVVATMLLAGVLAACGESEVVDEPTDDGQDPQTVERAETPEDSVVLTVNQPVTKGDFRLVLVGVGSDSVELTAWDRGGKEDEASVDVGDSVELLGLTIEVFSAGVDSDFDKDLDGADKSSAVVRIVDVDEDFGSEIGDDRERVVASDFEVQAGHLWLDLVVEDDESLTVVAEGPDEELKAETDVEQGDDFELFDLHFEVLDVTQADPDYDDAPSVRLEIVD